MSLLDTTCSKIQPLDPTAMDQARQHQDRLTKPQGALGDLEHIAIQLAGITGTLAPALQRPTIVVVAADHGVAAEGVSAYPASVTAQMVANFLSGGAAVNVLARLAGAEVLIVDAGVQMPIVSAAPQFRAERLGPGTANLLHGPAMAPASASESIERGIQIAFDLAASGVGLIALGEMGIANTTAAACITAVLTETAPSLVTGPGTGLTPAQVREKISVIERAIARVPANPDALTVLSEVGGFEIGVLCGIVLGAAARRTPLVLDGFITLAAALLAQRLCPDAIAYCIAAHCGSEPGNRSALDRLHLRHLLQLNLRLGEGSGAALAIPLIQAAARIAAEMATFGSAGVDTAITH